MANHGNQFHEHWFGYLDGKPTSIDDPHDALMMHMGICGCGNRAAATDLLLAALTAREAYDGDGRAPATHELALKLIDEHREGAAWLLLYIMDAYGFTEHGGSVNGAWLTDEGRKAIDVLRAGPKDDWDE